MTAEDVPITGARVFLDDGDFESSTNIDGQFVLEGVTSGPHLLVIDARESITDENLPELSFLINVRDGMNNMITKPYYLPVIDTDSMAMTSAHGRRHGGAGGDSRPRDGDRGGNRDLRRWFPSRRGDHYARAHSLSVKRKVFQERRLRN